MSRTYIIGKSSNVRQIKATGLINPIKWNLMNKTQKADKALWSKKRVMDELTIQYEADKAERNDMAITFACWDYQADSLEEEMDAIHEVERDNELMLLKSSIEEFKDYLYDLKEDIEEFEYIMAYFEEDSDAPVDVWLRNHVWD